MELKKENLGYLKGSFLGLVIHMKDKKNLKLFDKRDSFLFSIVHMPYLKSNISSKTIYSAFGAELLRQGRITNAATSFKETLKF